MPRWKALAQRIRMEMDELERTVSTIARHWQSAQATKEHRDAFLNSVALNLHSFYNSLERALELVALEMDGGTLGGETWHAELLRQMTFELPSVRPAVISADTRQHLDEYRKFRHKLFKSQATGVAQNLLTRLAYIFQVKPVITRHRQLLSRYKDAGVT
jgi:hypothetical protein